MKNKYARRSRISAAKTRHIVRCFAADLTALQTAELTGVNRNTVNRYFIALRERIMRASEDRKAYFGIAEIHVNGDEANNGAHPPGGNSRDQAILFGIIEREGQVYTEVVPEKQRPVFQSMMRGDVKPSSVTNSRYWRGYDGLVDLGHGHYRVQRDDEFHTGERPHINGIEGFWGLAKVRFVKFKGVPKHTFHLHLKECEWRYNQRGTDKYKTLLSYLRDDPLS